MKETHSSRRQKTNTLFISHFVIGEKMAGPGIRVFHLSRVLSQYTNLTLAIIPQDRHALVAIQKKLPDVSVVAYRRGEWDSIQEAADDAEVIILSPLIVGNMPQLLDHPGSLVLDGYNPLIAEWLATIDSAGIDQQIIKWSSQLATLYNQYLAADFIICASERQRFWWFGQLELAGRINPLTFNEDRTLRNLVDIVPYGLPKDPPRPTKRIIKGVWPGIGEDDVVLLWGGGLWPWLDPLTALRAVHALREDYPQLKLIFPGITHPDLATATALPGYKSKAFQYARDHQLLDSVVFFGKWVPYEDWQSVLVECDIALSLHHDSFETQLAFRSRVLEYLWAGLPIISTTGEATSDMVEEYRVGKVVGYEDVNGVIQAIKDILEDSSVFQPGFTRARQELTWEQVAGPLIRFCQNPYRAADRTSQERLGLTHHERRIKELEALVIAYQNGRVMRLLKRLHDVRMRLTNWRP